MRRISRSRWKWPATALMAKALLMALDTQASAMLQDPDLELPTVIIQPSALDAFGMEAAHREELDPDVFLVERSAVWLPEALADLPGAGLQRTGPGQASPFLRGFTGFRTLLILDGFRFNHSAWREGPNQYFMTLDPEMLGEVQVRYGGGAVRYGSDAVGGTVILESRPAGPALPDRDHTATLGLRLASAERAITWRAEAGGRLGDRLLYRIGMTQRSQDDLVGGRHVGTQPGTAFDSAAGDARLTWIMGDQTWLTLAHQVDRQEDLPRTHRTQDALLWHGTSGGTDLRHDFDQDRDFTYLRLLSEDLGTFDRMQAGLGWHSQEESRRRVRSDGRKDHSGFDVDTLTAYLDFESTVGFGPLRFGADHSRDRIDTFRRDYDANGVFTGSSVQGPVADDATYDLSGVFLQAEWDTSTPWLWTAGARVTRAALDADRVQDPVTSAAVSLSEDWIDWTGEIGVLRSCGEDSEGYVSLSRAVRMPNVADLTRFDSARSNEIETPSPGLDPEQFLTLEVGARLRDDRNTVEVATFWTHVKDLITRFPTGRVVDGDNEVQKANAGVGQVYGVELSLERVLAAEWTAFADLTFAAGRARVSVSPGVTDQDPLGKMPPLHGQAGLRWQDPDSTLWVEGVARFADDQDRLSIGDRSDTSRIPPGGTPGYTVFSLYTGFQPRDHLDVALGVENLTDKDYRLHGSGVNEPGTNVILRLQWTF